MSCLACKHYELGAKCVAFPVRIPIEFMSGEARHIEVTPNQQGETVFELGFNAVNDGILDIDPETPED
jgi:hypothetical protein